MHINNYRKIIKSFIKEIQQGYDFKDSQYRKRLSNKKEIEKLAVKEMVKSKQEAIEIIEKVNRVYLTYFLIFKITILLSFIK